MADAGHYDEYGQWVAGSAAAGTTDASQTERDVAGMDLLDVFGFQKRHQEHQDAVAEDRNRGYWDTLRSPTAEQLMGPREDRDAQMDALRQMQEWGRGGLTGADRGMLETTRARDAQAAGASRRALSQQAQARGVGGSGLDFAGQIAASQQGQQQSSDAEAQMMQGAQQRALAAVQSQGNLAGNIREQDTGATQQAYQNQMDRAAGATGQYGTDASMRSRARDREQQDQAGLLGLVGSLL